MIWLGRLTDKKNEIALLKNTQAWTQAIWSYDKFENGGGRNITICGACFASGNADSVAAKGLDQRIVFQTRDPVPGTFNATEFHVVELLLARPKKDETGAWCPIILCCRSAKQSADDWWANLDKLPLDLDKAGMMAQLRTAIEQGHGSAKVSFEGGNRTTTALWLKAGRTGFVTAGKTIDTIVWEDHLRSFFAAFGKSPDSAFDVMVDLSCGVCHRSGSKWKL